MQTTTEERRGVYIVTTPDKQEHRTIRSGYRALMKKLRDWYPGAQLAVRFEEIQSIANGEIIKLSELIESDVKLAG